MTDHATLSSATKRAESRARRLIASLTSPINALAGFGFAVVVSPPDTDRVLETLNKHFPSQDIGYVSADNQITVVTEESRIPLELWKP